jgi:hypothetical protein
MVELGTPYNDFFDWPSDLHRLHNLWAVCNEAAAKHERNSIIKKTFIRTEVNNYLPCLSRSETFQK